jgi:excisionase family DNA binding protein
MEAIRSARLLDVAQAARRLHVSEDTIRRRLRDGSLRGFRIAPNGGIRIDERSVDALLVPYGDDRNATA